MVLICISLMISDVVHLFMCLLSIFARFKLDFLLLLSCVSSLYIYIYLCILDTNPLSDIWFTKIFSHSVGCHFILLIVFLAVQKLLSLM